MCVAQREDLPRASQVGTNPTGNLLASASRDGTVRFWDAMSGLCVKTLGDKPGAIGEREREKVCVCFFVKTHFLLPLLILS